MSPTQEAQDWRDKQRAIFAQPNLEDRVLVAGRAMVRTLGMRCPWCNGIFFGYQVDGQEREPYRIDQDPIDGNGQRQTCGNPKCHEVEENHQFQRRQGFREERQRHLHGGAA